MSLKFLSCVSDLTQQFYLELLLRMVEQARGQRVMLQMRYFRTSLIREYKELVITEYLPQYYSPAEGMDPIRGTERKISKGMPLYRHPFPQFNE